MADISALLPVRDWGLDRIEMSIQSLLKAVRVSVEVIVIDYGSSDGIAELSRLSRKLGCKYARIDADKWSRSKAMNAAAELATGRILLFADADLVFTPELPAYAVDLLDADPNRVLLFQARDLTSRFRPVDLIGDIDFAELEKDSTWRPRWGMGIQAQTRETFDLVRGFDNRMDIYGGEDTDISKRLRLNGRRLEWVSAPEIAIYHVWHPSSRAMADLDPETRAAVVNNSAIAHSDFSRIRNLDTWSGSDPLVSVVITTFNRALFLADSIRSVLHQTVQDFEIIIMDDGSEDNTKEVVDSFSDLRIRYVKCDRSGIPTLRNRALELSKGRFTAIHDDDDIMLPWSLEARLSALKGGEVAAYGAAYNFDNHTGELALVPGRPCTLSNLINGGKVFLHASILIETEVLRSIKYDTAFKSGSDFNLAVRLLRTGYKFVHCQEVVLLRRLHGNQVTVLDEAIQHGASHSTTFSIKASWSSHSRSSSRAASKAKDQNPYSLPTNLVAKERLFPYLPDHLVTRSVLIPTGYIESIRDRHIKGNVIVGNDVMPSIFVPSVSQQLWGELQRCSQLPFSYVGAQLSKVDSQYSMIEMFDHLMVNVALKDSIISVNKQNLVSGFSVCVSGAPADASRLLAQHPDEALYVTISSPHTQSDYLDALLGRGNDEI